VTSVRNRGGPGYLVMNDDTDAQNGGRVRPPSIDEQLLVRWAGQGVVDLERYLLVRSVLAEYLVEPDDDR
jgi:hypothetical protein